MAKAGQRQVTEKTGLTKERAASVAKGGKTRAGTSAAGAAAATPRFGGFARSLGTVRRAALGVPPRT